MMTVNTAALYYLAKLRTERERGRERTAARVELALAKTHIERLACHHNAQKINELHSIVLMFTVLQPYTEAE